MGRPRATKPVDPTSAIRDERRRNRLSRQHVRMRSLYVPDETWDALKAQAAREGVTLSEHVRAVLAREVA